MKPHLYVSMGDDYDVLSLNLSVGVDHDASPPNVSVGVGHDSLPPSVSMGLAMMPHLPVSHWASVLTICLPESQ